MRQRTLLLACVLLAAAACSRGTPTEPAAESSIPLPDQADRVPEDIATPPIP